MRKELDAIDRRILRSLQRDATQRLDALAEAAGLSSTACWRRIKRLEEEGVIEKRVTLLSPRALGLSLTGFVMVRTGKHTEAWLSRFAEAVALMEEVVEVHRMTGDIDYMLKVVMPDLASYDRLYRRLIRIAGIKDVSASFSMETLKGTTELPLSAI